MTKEQVAFLMQNGFTVEEIMGLSQPQENPAQENPTQENPAQENPAQENPAQENPAQDMTAQIAALAGAVDNLTQLVQKGNIGGISFGTPPQDRTADDILAEIINPPQRKK